MIPLSDKRLTRLSDVAIAPRAITALLPRVPGARCGAVRQIVVACLTLILITCGCRAPLKSVDVARDAFYAGDLAASHEMLSEAQQSSARLADPAELDLAVVELASGDHRAAERRLRNLRDRFDALPPAAPLHDAASMVSDDTVRKFRPASYEEIMIRALLAVCSLAGDASDAESYCLQAQMKQDEFARAASERASEGADLEIDMSESYQPIALAPYMRGMLREATHRDYGDAVRSYQLVSAVSPSFRPIGEDINRASGGTHSAPQHGVLYVIACVGKGPQLVETVAPTTTASLQIASSVLNATANQSDDDKGDLGGLPNIASVKVPSVEIPYCDIAALGVHVDGQLFGATQMLTDVGDLAHRQIEAEMPWTIARAVARRVTKETTVAGTANVLGLDGTAAQLFQFAAASAWSGTEQADTRCWGLLPREIQVLRAELPIGEHTVALEPLDTIGRSIAGPQTVTTEIRDGRNRYLIVIAPGTTVYVANP